MSGIATFISMTILIFLYSYLIGGQSSMLMLYMLLLAPAVSAVLTFLIRKKVVVDIHVPKNEIEKDGKIKVEVFLNNKSFLPIPFVDVVFSEDMNFTLSDSSTLRVSLGPKKSTTVAMEYTAKWRGEAKIGVERMELRGYLGILRLSLLKYGNECRNLRQVTVIPPIINLGSTIRILSNSKEAQGAVDGAENNAYIINGIGEPGYDFREYEPGDPLHKIHWKLSAKREVFMVRKDQGTVLQKKFLILDPWMPKEEVKEKKNEGLFSKLFYDSEEDENLELEKTLLIQEKLLEALLFVANSIINTGREAAVCLFEQGRWLQQDINKIKDIAELQYRLAAYAFPDRALQGTFERIPTFSLFGRPEKGFRVNGGEAIIFTCNLDEELQRETNNCLDCKLDIDIVLVQEEKNGDKKQEHSVQNLWLVDPI